MKLPRRTTLTFRLTIVLWLASAFSCLIVTLISTMLLIANLRNDTLKDLHDSTVRLIDFGLQDLSVEDENEKLPDILKGVLSITRSYRIIRIFDEWGILMFSNFPHDEVTFLDEDFSGLTERSSFHDQPKNYVSYRASYRLSSGERRIIQMSQPLPRLTTVLKESVLQYSLIFLVLLVAMLIISSYMAGRLMRPVRNFSLALKSMRENDLKSWRAIPDIKDGDFLDEIVLAINQLITRVQTSAFANQALARFLAHEVRTPLTMMLGEIDTSKYSPKNPEDYRAMLEVFEVDIKKIDQIVNTILQMAQRDRNQNPSKPVNIDLKAILTKLIIDFKSTYFVDVGLVVEENLPEVAADPDLFTLLVDNLVRNSVKHGGLKAAPSIRVFHKTPKIISLEMRDSGPGVSDEIVEVINQNDPTVQTGIGIGLTLCREICNLSGLKMTFENLRPGLRVLVDLPVSRDLQERK